MDLRLRLDDAELLEAVASVATANNLSLVLDRHCTTWHAPPHAQQILDRREAITR